MEKNIISNETKAKVFAQYLGQKTITRNRPLLDIGRLHYYFWAKPTRYHKIKLILKPLSAITKEHAIEVAQMFRLYVPENTKIRYKKDTSGFDFAQLFYEKDTEIHEEIVMNFDKNGFHSEGDFVYGDDYLNAYQYLQSKGYDLPHYLLGGKTLHEAGLAIYED